MARSPTTPSPRGAPRTRTEPLMRIKIARDHEEMSRHAAARIVRAVRRKPDLLLGSRRATPRRAPTSGWPRDPGQRARPLRRGPRGDARRMARPRPGAIPQPARAYVRERILGPLGIGRVPLPGLSERGRRTPGRVRTHVPLARAPRPLDLCILGLGRNGHLLMNEPARSFDPGRARGAARREHAAPPDAEGLWPVASLRLHPEPGRRPSVEADPAARFGTPEGALP